MKVHYFDSTGEAYDASQTDDEISDGDVLSVPSEGAAAVLIQAWPTALDEATAGEAFHVPAAEGFDWAAVECIVGMTNGYADDSEAIRENRDYNVSAQMARAILDRQARVRKTYEPGTRLAVASPPPGVVSSGDSLIRDLRDGSFDETLRGYSEMGWTVILLTVATAEVVNYGD